ncbi:MAG TPA: DUF2851 family protein [Verrucomicrobiae bacterium]|nr:DUF2851 family protein [Verrucomicrobiae bacterium]
MSPSTKKFYAAWRTQSVESNLLRDANDFPAERLLQAIWQHQRLRRDGLKTSGGKSVRVLHPGFVSATGGPDFRDAVLQFENEKPVSGDVEIDLRAGNWRAHGHDKNPNFKNVLLHVVWENEVQSLKSNVQSSPTILPLKNFLDAPLAELSSSLKSESLRTLPENLRGKCCAPLRELSEIKLTELLNQAARVRFENKAAQFCARAKNVGWEQTLWENLFRALGYKSNVWPMQSLAEMKPLWSRGVKSAFEFQTRLLGVSGLLPAELTRAQKSSDTYLRRVWDFWWRERDEFADSILPRSVWKFHGLRPANHPQRRLALAAHWLADKHFISKIENWCATEIADKKLLDSLLKLLQVESGEFWSWHWTFKSARLAKPQWLLGEARATDLAVNVILPWLWIRAKEGGNAKIEREVERRYFAWPAAEDNSVLKLARQRLLGNSNVKIFKTASAQQGLLQIVRDFCAHSNAVCEHCRFPELARDWKRTS